MINPEHSRIIHQMAKKIFKPYGIIQKGKSRLWLDDNNWFTILIEFQPFLGRKGTTLNVGVNFHWYKQEYFSFDIGNRQDVDFIEFEEAEKFSKEVEAFCNLAVQKVLEYRDALRNLNSAFEFIIGQKFTSEDLWGNYHKGMICGLTNNFEKLEKFYNQLLSNNENGIDWITSLKQQTCFPLDLDKDKFMKQVLIIINETRRLKKLSGETIQSLLK